MSSIPRLAEWRKQVLACVLLLLVSPLHAAATDQVQQALQLLGLQRFFSTADALVARELAHYSVADGRARQLRRELSTQALEGALEAALLERYQADVYQQLIDTLSAEAFAPVLQSCHGEALQNYAEDLQAYEQQLVQRPAKASRRQLAVELDQAARSVYLASEMHRRLEQLIQLEMNSGRAAPPQPEAEAQRRAILQESMQVWYLFCGRFFSDELLQALLGAYRHSAVQRVLDDYQWALDRTLDSAAARLGVPAGEQQ